MPLNINNGSIKSFESLLLKYKNVDSHPQLTDKIVDYLATIDAFDYTPSEEVIAAILDLDPTDPDAQVALDALEAYMQSSGLTLSIISDGEGPTASLTIDENTTEVTTALAYDPQNDPVTYTISGGADASLFEIDAATGELRFIDAPDFEAPADAGGDNVYDVTVTASDGGQTDSQDIAVTVADVDEATTGLTLDFGHEYARYANETVIGSAGNDTITFGDFTAESGNLSVDAGAGNDMISFGDLAGFIYGSISVDGGAGNDTISFGEYAAVLDGNISVDLGFDDGAADELIFNGSIENASVQNWIAGEDALVDVVDPLNWTGVDNGADTVFTAAGAGGQSITFEGVTGLGSDVDDFLF